MLVVGGCSFSSDFEINRHKSYPHLISTILNTELINQARIQGSNWRIWRTITNHIINGDINSKDLLLIQYTEIHRQEFWVPIAPRHQDQSIHEPFDSGRLFKFKFGSHMYGEGIEKPLSNMLYRCSNEKYELEKFVVMHEMFCGLLKHRGFDKVYFLDTVYSPFDRVECKHYPVINGRHLLDYHLPGDPWHLSEEGHRRTAELILNVIKS